MNNRATPTDYFVNFSGILFGLKLDKTIYMYIYGPSNKGVNCCHNSHVKINANVQFFYNIQAYAQNMLILINYTIFYS